MKIISISNDKKVLEDGSAVLDRSQAYASLVEEMHIIVFSLKKDNLSFRKINNLYIYPTNSLSKWLYVFDAIKIGKKIISINILNYKNCVLSTQDPFLTGFVGVNLSKKYNLPLQIQIHTDFLSPHFSGILNIIRRLISVYTLNRSNGIRVVSDIIKNSLNLKFPKLKARIDVLPIFIDTTVFEKESDINTNHSHQFKFVIFMASRLTREKRIDLAIKSLIPVVGEFPKTGIVIAGSGPELSNLKRYTKSLGLQDNVLFIGWQKSLAPYFKDADMFLLTSEYEGYGMTLIEAGIAGCPIVTTKVGIAKTSLFRDGENSRVCPVADTKCMSNAILDLIHNNAKREVFKRVMRDDIKGILMPKDEYVSRYVQLLDNLIKK